MSNDITKPNKQEILEEKPIEGVEITQTDQDISRKSLFFKAVVKNAPNLLTAIPGIGNLASASLQTLIGTATDYYDGLTNERRFKELESFDKELDKRLSKLEIKDEAKEYWENTIVFKREDIMRKLMTEPGKGFDVLLAEYVASALSDLSTPPEAKDFILSSLLSIDSVDLKVLQQIDTQFKWNLQTNNAPGVKVDVIQSLMKSSGVDSIMISRSLQRLQGQDLIHPLNPSQATIHEMPSKQGLLEGEKNPQYYPGSGFVISSFGRRFLRFLKLSD